MKRTIKFSKIEKLYIIYSVCVFIYFVSVIINFLN